MIGVATGDGPGWWGSLVLGVVEGLTEFLPVSSTGHLIVAHRAIGGDDPLYEVAIQAGAITAILVRNRQRLWDAARALVARRGPRDGARPPNLLLLLFVAALPASAVGLLCEAWIERALFRASTVAIALLVGGVLLLWLERWFAARERTPRALDTIGWRDAWWIGCFQVLALIPGTSRSGATIAGGLLCGLSRAAAAEFSFLLGLPILYGACALKLLEQRERLSGALLGDLLVGAVASFVTALLIVGPFVRFLERHTFRPFAWYRIGAGGVLLALVWRGVITD